MIHKEKTHGIRCNAATYRTLWNINTLRQAKTTEQQKEIEKEKDTNININNAYPEHCKSHSRWLEEMDKGECARKIRSPTAWDCYQDVNEGAHQEGLAKQGRKASKVGCEGK